MLLMIALLEVSLVVSESAEAAKIDTTSSITDNVVVVVALVLVLLDVEVEVEEDVDVAVFDDVVDVLEVDVLLLDVLDVGELVVVLVLVAAVVGSMLVLVATVPLNPFARATSNNGMVFGSCGK